MDLDKLVEDGAVKNANRVRRAYGLQEMTADQMRGSPGFIVAVEDARAVLAIALAAAAEEADAIANEVSNKSADVVNAVADRLRILATQLGGKTDG